MISPGMSYSPIVPKKETHQSIAQVVLVQLLRRRPDIPISRKVGRKSLQGLPRHEDGAVGGLVEELPAEGCLVSGDEGSLHQP